MQLLDLHTRTRVSYANLEYNIHYKGWLTLLELSDSERDLGIQVQPDHKWKEHTQICVKKHSEFLVCSKTRLKVETVNYGLIYSKSSWDPI